MQTSTEPARADVWTWADGDNLWVRPVLYRFTRSFHWAANTMVGAAARRMLHAARPAAQTNIGLGDTPPKTIDESVWTYLALMIGARPANSLGQTRDTQTPHSSAT